MSPEVFVLPASLTQRRLWLLDRLHPGSAEYNIVWAVRLTGPLRPDALEAALGWLVARHEALRTSIVAVDGEPAQRVVPAAPVRLPVTDLTNLPEQERERRAIELVDEIGAEPFDLAEGPLLRLRLVRLAAEEHVLALVVHHIVADGWSFDVVFAELGQAYQAAVAGGVPDLPPPDIQYGDFAIWQRERAEQDGFAEELNFWRARLADAPTLLDLPADRPRPAEQSPAGGLVRFSVPARLADGVRSLARSVDSSEFAVLLAAFQCLLHRLTGQSDLLVGVPVAGRSRPETRGVVGFFANTLALRARFDENGTFAETLSAARESTRATQTHQDVPFEQLVEALCTERSLAYSPLVQVMFALEEAPAPVRVAGVEFAPELRENGSVKFDLTLTVQRRTDGLVGRITYRTDLYDAERIEALAAQYLALLEAAIAAPDTPVAELPLLDAAQRQALTQRWRGEAWPREHRSLGDLLRRLSAADPDAVAVSAPGRVLTYRELAAASDRLAERLRAHGVGPDVPVGLCLSRGVDMVTAIVAVWKAGGGYLPLDPELPAQRLAQMVADAAPPVLLTDADSAARTADVWPATTRLLRLDEIDDEPAPATTSAPPAGHPDALAYLLYTSGSTGQPKGVSVTHGAVLDLLTGLRGSLDLTPADRMAAITTYAFDISVVELILPLLAGARVEMFDAGAARDAVTLRAELAARQVTVVQATPATWRMLVTAGGVPTGVRLRISGGEALHRDLADTLTADGATLINGYGPSETTVYSTFGRVRPGEPVDLGDPVAGTRLYLLDRAGQPVPVGVVGELYIGGAGVARGYHGAPARTAASFRPDPFCGVPGARMYATGDLARWLPNGRLEYLGRADHQVKLRGYRIEPGEIEAVLRDQPGIADAVVVPWRHGPDDLRLVGYVVADDSTVGAQLGVESGSGLLARLKPALARRLPEYMLPATLVVLDRLPRTASGKIDRRALPEPVWRDTGAAAPQPARNPVEQRLAGLWCEVLGLEEVGVHDNFFALGGHSLTATRLMARIRDAFAVDLPLRQLFAAPTIAELALVLQADAASGHSLPDRGLGGLADAGRNPQDLLASLDTLSDSEIDELLNNLIAEEGA